MFEITEIQKQHIANDAIAAYDNYKECGGLILDDGVVMSLSNKAAAYDLDPSLNFVFSPLEYKRLESRTVAIFHSHINSNANFTPDDIVLCRTTNKPLILYDVASNSFKIIDPSGDTPLLGRDFCYGIYDCLSLVRDYYKQENSIELPDYDRVNFLDGSTAIWDNPQWDVIGENVDKWGFTEVKTPSKGDVIGFSIGTNTHVNHLGIYLGADRFMHQLIGRKSCIEVWGVPWCNYAVKFWRYTTAIAQDN